MLEVLDQTLQKFGAVRVLIQPVARLRAVASHLRTTLQQRENDEPEGAAAASSDVITALAAATNAMDVCESYPLRAVFFYEFYRSQLTRAVDVLLRTVAAATADAATTTATTDPVLQYIISNATTARLVASSEDDVPDADLINALDRLMMQPESGLDEFIRHLERQGIVADQDDFHRQLHEMSGLRPGQQRQPPDKRIWPFVDKLARILVPIATIVPASGNHAHHDWTTVQRDIRNAITVQNFDVLYNNALSIGNLPNRFGIHADAYETWASNLTSSDPDRQTAALALHRHVSNVRLFYFELYRRYQSGWIDRQDLLDREKWFINGLMHCLRADRAYTLVHRRLDWIRQNDLLSRWNNNSFRCRRVSILATIHPIYESYVEMFPALVVNHRTILQHQRPAL